MSVEATNATSPSTASSPASSPCSGPCPSRASSTTSHAGGQLRQLLARARTTTTGPSTPRATTPHVRRSSVEPCQSSHAFGVPMRLERPPASTIPAGIQRAYPSRRLNPRLRSRSLS